MLVWSFRNDLQDREEGRKIDEVVKKDESSTNIII